MRVTIRKNWLSTLVRTMILLSLPGLLLAAERDTIRKSFKAGSGGTLRIDTDRGLIEVRTHDRNDVEVEIHRSADDQEMLDNFILDFQQRGKNVTILGEDKNRRSRSRWWGGRNNRMKIEFLVTVPKTYNVDLKTSGGSISIDDLDGSVVSKTSGGALRFGDIKGDVDGRTSGGSVSIGRVDGRVDVHTSGGTIRIAGARGDVNAKTSGGGIEVEDVYGTIRARTSGGSITATLSQQPKADCRLTTSGGNITLYMNKDIGVYLDASTSGGSVRTDFPVTVQGRLSKRSLRADMNGGGPEMYLRTSGGSIRIKDR